ncbi:11707_t:CDS:2 [Paraglomus brasilianum]|uniref:11707_t:CDS:1 n=1 Tax=Paraglomus brasilianum TaxID=144538 RepID=A0A9N9F096_9GLOM|nr:11707_t:CDS:2 [Paraglomus brasilianum]
MTTATNEVIPITLQERLELSNYAIDDEYIRSETCNLASDRFIVVSNKEQGKTKAIIIDLQDTDNVKRHAISAQRVILSDDGQFIALQSNKVIQIFSCITKTKTGDHTLDDALEYWKWLNNTTLVIVTKWSIYYWKADYIKPKKEFNRNESLAYTQIINYVASENLAWAAVIGTKIGEDHENVGKIQLWNRRHKISRDFDGTAVAFFVFSEEVNGINVNKPLFAVASSTSSNTGSLRIFNTIETSQLSRTDKYCDEIPINFLPGDCFIDCVFSKEYGFFFLVTKFGFIHLVDVGSQALVYTGRISTTEIFNVSALQDSNGLLFVNDGGQVLSVTVDDSTLLQYIVESLCKLDIAIRLAARHEFPSMSVLMTKLSETYSESNQRTPGISESWLNSRYRTASGVGKHVKQVEDVRRLPEDLISDLNLKRL